ncbi:hypothetical protein BEWA_049200 [Theileria equi strain WA]|uniref:Signal peptide containing protein n=1 Tax=Theileria equi strain WA TaxID=1537102 RepID=L1LBB5_THEEQ|nr:hypothetical protein BEWA_049200 [Theileria equi strain WA]EKX72453.1 hypothetical protein BEWA_049200 [Theileria equi strain WA]|eukprot:XP_004831905.1 hypothetical protein BEWA_049200 [Theileria equi strain WA]
MVSLHCIIIALFTQNIALWTFNIPLALQNGQCARLGRSGLQSERLRPRFGGIPRDSIDYTRNELSISRRFEDGRHLATLGAPRVTHQRGIPLGCLISPIDFAKGLFGGKSADKRSEASLATRTASPVSYTCGIALRLWSIPASLRDAISSFYGRLSLVPRLSFGSLPENGSSSVCRFAEHLPGRRLLTRLLGPFHSLTGRYKFMKQLDSIKVYIAVDGYGSPIVSDYPGISYSLNKASDGSSKGQCNGGGCATVSQNNDPLKSSKPPECSNKTSKCSFSALFNKEPKKPTDTITVDLDAQELSSKVYLYFADKSACEAHVKELKSQGTDASVKEVTLGDYLRGFWRSINGRPETSWFGRLRGNKKASMHILLPMQRALVKATEDGRKPFEGTPVFTAEPPIICMESDAFPECKTSCGESKSEKCAKRCARAACSNVKVALFTDPDECLEVYKQIWSSGKLEKVVNGKKIFMKILGDGKRNPELKAASLEDLYKGVCKDKTLSGHKFLVI